MSTNEPLATGLLLTLAGTLLLVSVLFSRTSERLGVPVLLVFLAVGMLAGSEGLGGIPFDDYAIAYRFGTVALIFILFDGGLNTSAAAVRAVAGPAGVLATLGVAGTAVLAGFGARALGFDWTEAFLFGAIVSSTDAAAVFAVLRGSGLRLKSRVGMTLEVESGANDPMAVILTTALAQAAINPAGFEGWQLVLGVVQQITLGALGGAMFGVGGRWLFHTVRLPGSGLYSVLLLAIALLTFAVPTLVNGSGFLAVYVAGVILGNAELPYKSGLLRAQDALAWLSQITMFVLLGLLVFPSQLVPVALVGLLLALMISLVARPLVVWLCLRPFRYPGPEVAFIGWVGLRGAVPIILATFPVLAGVPDAQNLFNLVFFVVVVGAIIPGATVAWAARRLKLESSEPVVPRAVLEVEATAPLRGEVLHYLIDEKLPVAGKALSEIRFPEGSAATLLVRGTELVAPRGHTVLQPGDYLYVLAGPDDREALDALLRLPRPRRSSRITRVIP